MLKRDLQHYATGIRVQNVRTLKSGGVKKWHLVATDEYKKKLLNGYLDSVMIEKKWKIEDELQKTNAFGLKINTCAIIYIIVLRKLEIEIPFKYIKKYQTILDRTSILNRMFNDVSFKRFIKNEILI